MHGGDLLKRKKTKGSTAAGVWMVKRLRRPTTLSLKKRPRQSKRILTWGTSEESLRVVASVACSSSNTGFDPPEDFCHRCDHYFGSRKRLRLSYSEPFHVEARTCAGAIASPLHASIDGCFFHGTSQPSDGGTCQSVSSGGYAQNPAVSGWAYLNENGQMCGPYIREQLCEGLSTGFLPADLPVYPIINGSLMNPIALQDIGQFGSHLYYGTSGFPTTVSHNSVNYSMPGDQGSTASYSLQTAYAKESVNKTHDSYGACISSSHASNVKTGNHASTGLSNVKNFDDFKIM
ncbi:hypothetical protein Taro_002847 [Colocasia esculenta]|uniref:Uncharacterized protein n=1 Tax=Colocasia esculenta TaxID=4460 RepID=A0A843TDY4_COLES|nr:hypothetical protein [Colocasia esculenta]